MTAFICISSFNEGQALVNTVKSVYNRLHEIREHNPVVIISDDGSTDSSVGECQDKFVDLKVTKRMEPTGTSGAKSYGADLAIELGGGLHHNHHDIFIFLDGHTDPQEGCLKRLVKHTTDFGIIHPVIKGLEKKTWTINGSTTYGGYFCSDNFTTKFLPLSKLKDGPNGDLKLSYRISGGACAIRKDIYLDIGGWDKNVICFGADTSITLRAWCLGYNIYLATDAVIGHVFRKQFRPEVSPRWWQLYSNRLRLVTILGTQKDLDDLKINLQKKNASIARTAFKHINSQDIPSLRHKIKRTLQDYWNTVNSIK
jgi:GT2 family glycosyltransferase